MMTSFFNESELEKMTTVPDQDLNELLQEVRLKFDNKYFVAERKFTTKRFLRKPIVTLRYMVLLQLRNDSECQVVNFCQDHNYSINSYVTKSYVYTLFCGLLNGFDKGKETGLKMGITESQKRDNVVSLRPSFWFMRETHTFVKLEGKNVDEIKEHAIMVAKANPCGMVCPVTILEVPGDKEIRKVGKCVHVDNLGNVDLAEWYNEIVAEDCIRNFKGN